MNIQNVLQGIKYPQFQVKKEYLHILTWLLIFLVSPQLLRTVDLTAAPLDPGVLSILIVAVLAVLLFQALTWATLKLIWPVFTNYSQFHFEQNFKNLLPWQKILIYLSFYLFLLYSFVICFSALY